MLLSTRKPPPKRDESGGTMPGPGPEATFDALITVLNVIRLAGAKSRSEVSARTGLSRAIVSQRVGELIARGLLVDGEAGASTGGRPARRLTFKADAGYILVADIGATSIDIAVTLLDGTILTHRDEPSNIGSGPQSLLARVDELFREVTASTPGLPARLWGIGVGIPGPVEYRTGRPVSPPIMPGWDRFPVREFFADRFDAPVWVDNDVNIAALGEWRAGLAAGHDNVIVIKVGTGIGAGIISEGRLHRGAQGSAGDVGHVQIVDDPEIVCRCGNVGCLEALAGGAAIARDAQRAAEEGQSDLLRAALEEHGTLTAEDAGLAAARGDRVASALIEQAGRRIGAMLATVVNFFNPSLIVIGGGVAQSGDRLLAAVRESVYRRSLPLATRDLEIKRSALGNDAGVLGASAMVVDQVFSRECFAVWAESGTPAGLPAVALAWQDSSLRI